MTDTDTSIENAQLVEQENLSQKDTKERSSRKRSQPNDVLLDRTPPGNKSTPEVDNSATPITNARLRARVPQLYLTAGSTPPPTHLFKNRAYYNHRAKADSINRGLSPVHDCKRRKILESQLEEEDIDGDDAVAIPSIPPVSSGEPPKVSPTAGIPHITENDILNVIQKPVLEMTATSTPPIFTPERINKDMENEEATECGPDILHELESDGEPSLIGKILSRPSMGADPSDDDIEIHSLDLRLDEPSVEESCSVMKKDVLRSLNKIDPLFTSSRPIDPQPQITFAKDSNTERVDDDIASIDAMGGVSHIGSADIIPTDEAAPGSVSKSPDVDTQAASTNKLQRECDVDNEIQEAGEDAGEDENVHINSHKDGGVSAPDTKIRVLSDCDDVDNGIYVLDYQPERPAPVTDTARPAERLKRKTLPDDTGLTVPATGPKGVPDDVEVTVDIETGEGGSVPTKEVEKESRGRSISSDKTKNLNRKTRRSISEPRGRSGGPGGLAGTAVYKAHNTAFFIINPAVLEDPEVWDIVHLRRLSQMLGIDDENCTTHSQYVTLLSQWNRNPRVLLHSPDILTNYHAGVVASAVCNFNHMPIMRSKLPKRYRSIVDPLPKEKQLKPLIKSNKKKENRIKFSPYNHMLSFHLSAEERYDKKLCLYEIASLQTLVDNDEGLDPDVILMDPTRELAGDPRWELAKRNMLDNMRKTATELNV